MIHKLTNKLRNVAPDIKVALFLALISIILLIFFQKNLITLLNENFTIIIKILFLTVIAVGISTLIHFLLPAEIIEKHLKQNKLIYLFYATILGILTPGPVYAIYPIIVVLKKKGIQNPILVSYLTGQTIVGPARIPFEVGLFGVKFFIYRIILSIIIGPLAGLLYMLFSKILPDKD